MDYSAINYVIYTIGLKKEMFVIGGTFAAALSEPALARAMGGAGEYIELYVSSSNFEVLKNFEVRAGGSVEVSDNQIIIRDGYIRITFYRGVPAAWTNESGYQVQDPLPLKQWLNNNGYESWAKQLGDKSFEQRMAGWELTDVEEAFKAACAANDWHTGYSDDASVRRSGDAAYAALVKTRDELGGKAREIFEFYSSN